MNPSLVKAAKAPKADIDAAVKEMLALKEVCGEVPPPKAGKAPAPAPAPAKEEKKGPTAPAAAPPAATLTKGTPEDHAALAAAKQKVSSSFPTGFLSQN